MQKIQAMQQKKEKMQVSKTKKTYSMEELCPYPFDRSIYMPPSPPQFNVPNFNKYKGNGDIVEH